MVEEAGFFSSGRNSWRLPLNYSRGVELFSEPGEVCGFCSFFLASVFHVHFQRLGLSSAHLLIELCVWMMCGKRSHPYLVGGRSVLAKLLWVQRCCQKVSVGLPAPPPRMAQQRGSSAAAGGSCLQSHAGEPCRSAIVWATSPQTPFSLLAGFSNYLHPLEIGFKGSCGPLKYLVQNLGARNECITNSSSVTLEAPWRGGLNSRAVGLMGILVYWLCGNV